MNLQTNLFTIVLIFNRINCTAWSGGDREVKLGVFAVAACVAQERIFLVIVDCSVDRSTSHQSSITAELVKMPN